MITEVFGQAKDVMALASLAIVAGSGIAGFRVLKARTKRNEKDIAEDKKKLEEHEGVLTDLQVSIGKVETHVEWLVKNEKRKNGDS